MCIFIFIYLCLILIYYCKKLNNKYIVIKYIFYQKNNSTCNDKFKLTVNKNTSTYVGDILFNSGVN